MLRQWTKYLRFILTRTMVVYLGCFILIWLILDYHKLVNNAVPQTMSRLTPPMNYFTEFMDKKDHYNYFNLMNCINYHKAVAQFFAFQKAEADGMLGFCYERLGQEPQAVASYQQAIAFNPDYFWPYYNLGIIFYREGQYPRAADYFRQAIEQNPVKTIILLSRSKVYNDVKLSDNMGGLYNPLESLKQGRANAYILMMDSLCKTGSYELLWQTAMNGLKEGLDTQGIFYYYAGVAAYFQKSYQKAIDLLQMALQIDPHNADALLYIGECLSRAGKTDMAQLFISKAAQLHQQEGSIIEQYLKPRVRFF